MFKRDWLEIGSRLVVGSNGNNKLVIGKLVIGKLAPLRIKRKRYKIMKSGLDANIGFNLDVVDPISMAWILF